jgi:hypothetical protein
MPSTRRLQRALSDRRFAAQTDPEGFYPGPVGLLTTVKYVGRYKDGCIRDGVVLSFHTAALSAR